MARLRHAITGVVVNVPEDKVGRLDGYSPVEDETAKPKPARAKRAGSTTDDEK